jgi:hypothetical protein
MPKMELFNMNYREPAPSVFSDVYFWRIYVIFFY